MIIDLHTHSTRSDDGRATIPGYLRWLTRKSDILPIDGIVLTEHRQFDQTTDYRSLEDEFEIRLFRGAEVETDYGHVLVFGVNDDILARFDFADLRLDAQEVVTEVERLGGLAMPCHPGRATIGLADHYRTKPPLDGVRVVEALNGGSRRGEDERAKMLVRDFEYAAAGGSDAHLVSFVGVCATAFPRPIRDEADLARALVEGGYEPVDYRDRLQEEIS